MHCTRLLLCAVALTAAAPAQRTWIVDQNNGAGTNFTKLQPAVDAAAPGDTILVRYATYPEGFVLDGKGLEILGDGLFIVRGDEVQIRNVPANERVVLSNCNVYDGTTRGILIDSCAGRVYLHATSGWASVGRYTTVAPGLSVRSSATVTVTGGGFAGIPAAAVSGAHVSFTNATLTGADGVVAAGWVEPSGTGLEIDASSIVQLSYCDVTGGDGAIWPLMPVAVTPGQPAIRAWGSNVTITGKPGQRVHAGTDPLNHPVPAIAAAYGSAVCLDPLVSALGRNGGPVLGGPAYGAPATLVVRPVVAMRTGLGYGGLWVDVRSEPGDLIALFLGQPTFPQPSALGWIHLDLSTAGTALLGAAQQPTGLTFLVFPLPNWSAYGNVLLGLQAANLYHASGTIEMSNPGVVVLR